MESNQQLLVLYRWMLHLTKFIYYFLEFCNKYIWHHKADILLGRHFKHIVNIYRIRGCNSDNIRSNYQSLEIRSPKEILEYEY
jgi:hypothetical protein